MAQPAIETTRERFVPTVLETRDQVGRAWLKTLERSTFLTIKYGLIDGEKELDRISRLGPNWDSYGAEPPSANAVRASREILNELAGALMLPSAIVPSASGGISIYFIRGDRTAYIENYNDGTQALVMYGDDQEAAEVLEIGVDVRPEELSNRISRHLDRT
jgi:hypothetical protein